MTKKTSFITVRFEVLEGVTPELLHEDLCLVYHEGQEGSDKIMDNLVDVDVIKPVEQAVDMVAYLQDADGNERTLEVTRPDPFDGTYCVFQDEEGFAWIRIVPGTLRHEEDRLGGVVEAAIDKAMDDNDWVASMASDPSISQNHVDDVYLALESYICDHLARITK